MHKRLSMLVAALSTAGLLSGCTLCEPTLPPEVLREEVMDTELAFAQTMATRDHEAFVAFLADEAVFFTEEEPFRGKEQVEQGWKRYFEKPEAPFSWEPEQIEVLASGTLALSTGAVFAPDGTRIATFTSIWRREASGDWRIVFDKGCPVCAAP